MVKWISVKDKLPKTNGKYLVFDGKDVTFGMFEDGYFLMMDFPKVRYYQNLTYTHWMPLPSPPNKS
jgi:hypothetical protein